MKLTQKELQRLLHYDPETGIFTWKISISTIVKIGEIAGVDNSHGYLRIQIHKKRYRNHHLAWLYVYGELPKFPMDHLNGIRKDNRISNLRKSSNKMNAQNQRIAKINNKLGLLGVYKFRNKFRAHISIDGKRIHLGLFKRKEDASEAYLNAKRKYHEACTI